MMNLTIELAQAEVQLAKLIREVEGRAEVVITCNGQPVAPYCSRRRASRYANQPSNSYWQ